MSTVTLRNAILEARAALTGATAVTDLVPERNITFGNSPQKDEMPRIVIEVSSAEYDATYTQSRKVQTFTVEYAVYSDSVDTCTAIMDEVRLALDAYTSSAFAVRVTDESFQAELDNTLLGVVVSTFQDTAGIPGFDATTATELAAWEAAAGVTLEEFLALPAKRIAYPSIPHMDVYHDTSVTYGSNSYTGMLNAGELSPGAAPANILHVAELDPADVELKTLLNNNEFGNKRRFTYDDGTEATEVGSSSASEVINAAANEGYTGSNPQYIIDHLTGLGYWRGTLTVTTAASGDWWNARGLYDHFVDVQDFVDAPGSLTLAGYTDWRRPSFQEWIYSIGPVDVSNWLGSTANAIGDVYFPPVNGFLRVYGGNVVMLGPTLNGGGFSTIRSQTNSGLSVEELNLSGQISSANNNNMTPTFLCRRHYSNS